MEPIIQWVGGKKRLLNKIKFLMPKEFNTYHEIFLGGGCLLLNIEPETSYNIEKNINIFMIYENIKNHKDIIVEKLKKIESEYLNDCEDRKEYYIDKRTIFNTLTYDNTKDSIYKTVILLFLNKTCFNALYRENSKGGFNVPFGNGKDCCIYNEERINNLFDFINKPNTHIVNEDFEYCLQNIKEGDFVYIDPPYYPLNKASFTNYDKSGFGIEDHDRLINMIKTLDKKKVNIMLSNSNNSYFKDKLKELNIYEISVARTLNCKKENRRASKCEVIMTNYNLNKIIELNIKKKDYELLNETDNITLKVSGKNLYYCYNNINLSKVEDNIKNLLLDNKFTFKLHDKKNEGDKYYIKILIG